MFTTEKEVAAFKKEVKPPLGFALPLRKSRVELHAKPFRRYGFQRSCRNIHKIIIIIKCAKPENRRTIEMSFVEVYSKVFSGSQLLMVALGFPKMPSKLVEDCLNSLSNASGYFLNIFIRVPFLSGIAWRMSLVGEVSTVEMV